MPQCCVHVNNMCKCRMTSSDRSISYGILYTVYDILYTVYCILYTVYCILYTVYCILYTVYCIRYTVDVRVLIYLNY